MPIISDIKPGRRAGRYSVYADGKYVFSLGDLELSNSGLKIGQQLTDQEVEDWKTTAVQAKARDQAFRYLSIRSRSMREMAQYLQRKGYEPTEIAVTQEYLQGLGYLDDRAFAKAWVEYRQNLSPRSRMQLAGELRAKGIASDIIDETLQSLDPDDQKAVLQQLVARKRRLYDSDQKLINYLARRGFSITLIREVLSEAEDPE